MKQIRLCFAATILLLLISTIGFSQSEAKKKEVADKMWSILNADFTNTEVPDKWKNESAVILCRSFEYQVKKEMSPYVLENLYTRYRIKLQDEAAVQEYSQMSFAASKFTKKPGYAWGAGDKQNIYVGIKIIKPNGKQKEIPISEAVTIGAKAGLEEEKFTKIALSDLEPGDIIDYYYCAERTAIDGEFDRILYYLADKHPIMAQEMSLRIMRDCYVSASYLNGAPFFQTSAYEGSNTYKLTDRNREKVNQDQPWFFENRSVPTINFQAFPASNQIGWTYYWLGTKGRILSKIQEYMLLNYINKLTNFYTPTEHPATRKVLSFMNTYHKRETNPEVLARELYNLVRQREFVASYEQELVYGKRPSFYNGMSNVDFMVSMSNYLKRKEINHDFIIATPRTLSDIKDLILLHDATYLIRVNTSKPFYIGQPARFDNYYEVGQALEGTNAYAVNMLEESEKRDIKKVVIPASSHQMNSDSVTLKVTFDIENPEQIQLTRVVMAKGSNRFSHMDAIAPYDYLYDSRADKYEFELLENKKASKKDKEALAKKIAQLKEQHAKDRLDNMKKSLEGEFDAKIVSYDQFTLKKTGIWPDQSELSYQDEYKMEGLIESAGNGYLLNIGKLIGKQIDLTKEQLSRKDDIYMPYARSFNYEIEVSIPAGYEVKGLDKIQYNVTNSTGGFVSLAKMEGNTLKVITQKYYTHNYEKVEKWPDMTAFIEAAYTFTQQKLLLQKIGR